MVAAGANVGATAALTTLVTAGFAIIFAADCLITFAGIFFFTFVGFLFVGVAIVSACLLFLIWKQLSILGLITPQQYSFTETLTPQSTLNNPYMQKGTRLSALFSFNIQPSTAP
ncbi:hypothetical protein JI58_00475 [Marinosulfonomonas sp. PRT-SC04]|nr:hypothetical protein JI58_00475 [Marinosulfonomonas sp. PRT-SC04]